jgi:hypothetical protein
VSASLALPRHRPRGKIPYRPHAVQKAMHAGVRFHRYDTRPTAKRFGFWVCHRRLGKTVALVNHLNRAAITFPRNDGRFAYMGPLRNQTKLMAWEYAKQFSKVAGARPNESELRLDYPNGSKLWLAGADNPDAIRGGYFDLAGLDEFGQMYRRMWGEIIRPALADREGSAIVSGTPKGKNAFFDLYEVVKDDPSWDVHRHPISETSAIPGLMAVTFDARHGGQLPITREEWAGIRMEVDRGLTTEAEYQQEFELAWEAAMRGSYFAEALRNAQAEGRIGSVPYDPNMRVTTGWDLGMRDALVIWFAQALMGEVRIIDHMSFTGRGLTEVAKELHAKPYVYAEHLLPHDVEVREQGTGRSRREVLAGLGINVRVMPRLSARQDFEEDERISAIRQFLPRCVFHAERCKEGLEGLQAYRRDENARGELQNRPCHDWASHHADAFGMLAQGLFSAPRMKNEVRLNPVWAAPT